MCEKSPILPKQKFRIWIVYCAFIYDSHIRLILETRLYVLYAYCTVIHLSYEGSKAKTNNFTRKFENRVVQW